MSAEERLLPEVTMTSPEGNVYNAKFIDASSAQGKLVAIFKTIGGNFGRAQNLGTDLRPNSFIAYFEGDDHDIDSEVFIESLQEDGYWVINHPVLGRLENQLPILFDPTINPVRSGNITAVATSWITDYPDDAPISQAQRANQIQASVSDVNEESSKSFFDNIQSQTSELKNKIDEGVQNMQSVINSTIGPLLETVEGASDVMTALGNGINSTLDSAVLQSLELVAQCQAFCQLPAQLLQTTAGRLDAYRSALSGILDEDLTGTDEAKRNQAFTAQMIAGATYCGLALSYVGNSQIQTRLQAIEAAQIISSELATMTNSLDTYAEEFDGLLVHEKYFSQTDAFSALSILAANVQDYLLDLSVSLKREKTVILDTPLSAYFIALKYYGSADDDIIDQLITTNNLTLEEIMRTEAGREIVIYV